MVITVELQDLRFGDLRKNRDQLRSPSLGSFVYWPPNSIR